jgi:hypothetical protein
MAEAIKTYQKQIKKTKIKLKRKLRDPHLAPDVKKNIIETFNTLKKTKIDTSNPPDDIFLVSSFNDWMPARMKTNRRLTIEKL